MKVVSWNVRRAIENRDDVWSYFREINPDIALLQEVGSFPESILREYSIVQRKAYAGSGRDQKFHTAVAVKGSIQSQIEFSTPWEWVNDELANFKGNLVAAEISLPSGQALNVVSVYCPAWPVFKRERHAEIDVSTIKLKNNPDVWLTEIMWAALSTTDTTKTPWIVAGDLNSSVTFDTMWKGGPRGNQEIQDRMSALGFTECLKHHNGELIPTFKNPSNKQLIHQMDHCFVTKELAGRLASCVTGDVQRVLNDQMSDHLPIIAEFQ